MSPDGGGSTDPSSWTCSLRPDAAERVDGEIRAVTPHDRDGAAQTVADRLDTLEATLPPGVTSAESEPSATAD